MRRFIVRAVNVMLRPDSEWAAIARERHSWAALCCNLVPLALVAPLAYSGGLVLGGDGAMRAFADAHATLRFALLAAGGGFLASLLSVFALAAATWLVAPLFAGRRSFGDACRVVIYAGTPVWLSGIILIAPVNRFPLLVVIILVAIMHSTFLFYLGVHHVLSVPRRDAAESTAIIMAAGILLSTVAGYYASAAGLFPYL